MSALSFHVKACANAIKNAGLKKDYIDGLFIYMHFTGQGNKSDIIYHI